MADAYSMVGFQNHLRYGEQARVLRAIPDWNALSFLQFGQIHRNTYLNSPRVLAATMQMREHPNIFFAGQITGVEGYVESVAMGLVSRAEQCATATERMNSWWRPAGSANRSVGAICLDHRDEELPTREHHFRPAQAAYVRTSALRKA
jgi:tRNA:m(5)U-54 methyltransferase